MNNITDELLSINDRARNKVMYEAHLMLLILTDFYMAGVPLDRADLDLAYRMQRMADSRIGIDERWVGFAVHRAPGTVPLELACNAWFDVEPGTENLVPKPNAIPIYARILQNKLMAVEVERSRRVLSNVMTTGTVAAAYNELAEQVNEKREKGLWR